MDSAVPGQLGRYEILDRLGSGSIGVVYRARDRESGAVVAIKTLGEGIPVDDRDLDLLRRTLVHEAERADLLSHPGIVAVHDLVDDWESGQIYLVMEYVEGRSLAEILSRSEPIPLDFSVEVVTQVAAVLDHLHAHGAAHRDLKPANILVTPEERVKITDFGIAQLGEPGLPGDLLEMGSPAYLAPERVVGAPADYRSDIYALGVVLYQLLTRHLPFEADTPAELTRSIALDPPIPAETHVPNLLPSLRQVLEKALAKEPAERYQYAGELAADLARIRTAQAEMSDTVPTPRPPEREVLTSAAVAVSGLGRRAADLLRRLSASRRLRWLAAALLVAAALALAVPRLSTLLADDWGGAGGEEAEAPAAEQLDYLKLLEEGRKLMRSGEHAAAERFFELAENVSPMAGRISQLREEARVQAQEEAAEDLELTVAGLIGIAEQELEAGRLWQASEVLGRALELYPEHDLARQMAVRIERARASRAARRAPPPPPQPPPAPEPQPPRPEFQIAEPIRLEPVAPAPDFADLRLDFFSRSPRGVLTVYLDQSQVFRRPFRFLSEGGLLRRQGTSGGFDDQRRVSAGGAEIRVYLSLPKRQTQLVTLTGALPPGGLRTLQVRVDESGTLTAILH